MLFQLFKTPSISTKELQSRLSKEITLLDVRTPANTAQGIFHKRLMSHLTKFPPTTNPLTKS